MPKKNSAMKYLMIYLMKKFTYTCVYIYIHTYKYINVYVYVHMLITFTLKETGGNRNAEHHLRMGKISYK